MTDQGVIFNQLNLVVGDMDASLAFYRRLGLDIHDAGEWPEGSGCLHTEVELPNGMTLELDNLDGARTWHPDPKASSSARSHAVIGFAVSTRDAVDDLYAALTATGGSGRQKPYDAFWGSRYAIVTDPDGNEVGLMSPRDDSMRSEPAPPPSD